MKPLRPDRLILLPRLRVERSVERRPENVPLREERPLRLKDRVVRREVVVRGRIDVVPSDRREKLRLRLRLPRLPDRRLSDRVDRFRVTPPLRLPERNALREDERNPLRDDVLRWMVRGLRDVERMLDRWLLIPERWLRVAELRCRIPELLWTLREDRDRVEREMVVRPRPRRWA